MQWAESIRWKTDPARTRWILIVLIIVTLLTYLPSLRNGFVDIDDGSLITQNAIVLRFTPRTVWVGFTTFDPELYIPLTFFSYQLETALFGMHAFIFHFTNLILHVGTALLVFAVMRRLTAFRSPNSALIVGFFCAFVFALHPLNTEAVVWAAARKDVLSAFLFFATFLAYLRYRSTGKRRMYLWSVSLFLLALLAKVSVLFLPFILLLSDYVEDRRFTRSVWLEKIPYACLSLLFGCVALFGKQTQLSELGLSQKFLLACKAAAFYLYSLVWPFGLTIFHPQEMPMHLAAPDLWLPPFLILLLVATMVVAFRRYQVFFFGVAFYVLLLIPSFITFWKNGFVYFASERYAYVPMVGILLSGSALVVPWLRLGFKRYSNLRIFAGVVAALFLVLLGALSVRQSLTWRNPVSLNERALAVNPRSAHALNNLGSAYFAEGKYREALALFDRALVIDPALPAAYANRGQTLRQLGDDEGALKAFMQGIDSLPADRPPLPQDLAPFLRMAELLDQMGRSQDATQALRGAIQRLPRAPLPHYYLGVKEQQFGHLPEAREQFRIVTELDPALEDGWYRLAAISAELGDLPQAVSALEHVLALDPENAVAQRHLKDIKSLVER